MSWRVIIAKDSEKIKLKLDNIVIHKNDYDFIVPLSDISIIVLEGQQTTITTRLLSALTEYNISLVICDHTYTPCGIYHAYNGHSRASKLLQKQIAWDDELKGIVWKKIVDFKISNQIDVLCHFEQKEESIAKLYELKGAIELHDATNREGHAAKVYFNTLFGMKFSRQDEDNVINAGLDYGYAILRAYLARLVVAYGLQPMIGLFHKSEYNQFNLVDDLIEPFRPFVDGWVFMNMGDSDFLTFENRTHLINLLNLRANYKGSSYTLGAIMEKYVVSFVNLMNSGDIGGFVNPIPSSFEGWKREV